MHVWQGFETPLFHRYDMTLCRLEDCPVSGLPVAPSRRLA